MQWAVSDLAFGGFNKKYLSGLPLTYNIEFFYEFGTDHYWDTVLLPLAQNNKEKRTFSLPSPRAQGEFFCLTLFMHVYMLDANKGGAKPCWACWQGCKPAAPPPYASKPSFPPSPAAGWKGGFCNGKIHRRFCG